MRVVSYTRATTSKLGGRNRRNTVDVQNEHIRKYLAKQHWTLQETYSDQNFDKEETAAFDRLTADAVDRKYDCVVVDSVYRCGKDLWFAIELLEKILFPVGIHFAVAEDDFCSIGKSAEEVSGYFHQKRLERLGAESSKRSEKCVQEGLLEYKNLRYGYLLTDDRRGMRIDEEVSGIIRTIFERRNAGMSCNQIAAELNKAGIISPQEHKVRAYGCSEPNFITKSRWNGNCISRMLRTPIYMGEAHRNINGEDVCFSVPAIVPKELFLQVQPSEKKRRRNVDDIRELKKANILFKRICDKETGCSLECRRDKETPTGFVYTFQQRDRASVQGYGEKFIPLETVLGEVRATLQREKEAALRVDALLHTEEARQSEEKLLAPLRARARELVAESNLEYGRRLDDFLDFQSGKIAQEEYNAAEKESRKRLLCFEEEFRGIMEQAEQIGTAFSRINPWLKLYRDMEVPEALEREHVKKWVARVFIEDFQRVELIVKELPWKERLPQEWFSETEV